MTQGVWTAFGPPGATRVIPWRPNPSSPAQYVLSGRFTLPGASFTESLAAGDGNTWTSFSTRLNGSVRALASWDPDGTGPQRPALIAGGEFTYENGRGGDYVSIWNGASWASLGWGTDAPVNALMSWMPPGTGPQLPQLIAGGEFLTVGANTTGAVTAPHIARWDGASWRALGPGLDGTVHALALWDPDGSGPLPAVVAAGGDFHHAGNVAADDIAYWDGSVWRTLGWGFDGPVRALTLWDPDASGPLPPQLIAGGDFVYAGAGSTGQVLVNHLARWDGAAWRAVGEGLPATVRAVLAFDFDGDGPQGAMLVAGGDFGVLGWSGTAWERVAHESIFEPASPELPATVVSLASFDPDDAGPVPPQLYASGHRLVRRVWYGVDCRQYVDTGTDYSIARFDGLQAVNVKSAEAWALTSFDADGAGPGAPMLVEGSHIDNRFIPAPQLPVSAQGNFRLPVITRQPSDVVAHQHQTVTLAVDVVNAPGAAYQWFWTELACNEIGGQCPPYYCYLFMQGLHDGARSRGAVVAGGTTPVLTLSDVSPEAQGWYMCVITRDNCNTVQTRRAFLRFLRGSCSADFNNDGDVGTDADIEAFFACLAGRCCAACLDNADFNGDGDVGTDADIESFFRVLAGGPC